MKKELPRVYVNNISKKFKNAQETFYENEENRSYKLSLSEIMKKINDIFKSPNHVYKSKVIITINGKEEEKVIVGKRNDSNFTLDGVVININSISDIKKRS